MKPENSIISKLNPQYFWDVDLSKLDDYSSCRLVIERVFTMGEVREMNLLISFYGKEKIVDIICDLPYLDPKSLNFVSKFFHKPLKSFRCYRLKQSKPQHWNS